MSNLRRVAGVVCLCLLLAACGARAPGQKPSTPVAVETPANSGDSGSTGGSRASASPGPTQITVGPQASPGKTAAGQPAAAQADRAAAGVEFSGREDEYLLLTGFADRLVPADSRIGLLQDRWVNDDETRRMYNLVDGFFGELAKGRVAESVILPVDAIFLSRRLGNDLKAGYTPLSWRIGRIDRPDTGFAHMRIVIDGDPGSTIGDVFLEKSEDRWYISGVQADLAALATPPPVGKAIEPETPTWMYNAQ
ncbi:MAG TPA: hypothetical protein VMW87_12430 [Spirochaetia bacterium]|nr:hypothetical protein [Spirochaetia bacterium]